MMWYISWCLSFAALLLGVIASWVYGKRKERKIKPFFILFTGVFLSSVFMIYPIYRDAFNGDLAAAFKALVISIQNTIQFFTADSDYGLISDNITGLTGWLKDAYALLGTVLIILAPVLTFGFVLSFFKGVTAQIKYAFHSSADTYVFSEINQNTVSLAESIRAENPKAIIIFANAPQEEEQINDDLLDRIKQLHVICNKKDISLIKLRANRANKKTFFFALCDDESQSISEVLQLIPKYRNRTNTTIYLFSTSVESELILNNLDKGSLVVRRINPLTSFVNHVLSSEGEVLFDKAIDNGKNNQDISALILGAGQLGTEMLKALTWYCQMDNYRFKVNAFDIDESSKDRIAAQCPELLCEKYNGVFVEGEAFYQIDIHACDVNTESFRNKVRKIGNISFAFVSLGNDSLNITAAVNLRILFEQMRIHPVIMAVVSNPEKSAALTGAKDKNGTPYDIQFVGDAKTIYSATVIINPELEKDALELHKRYNNGDPYGFYEFEYNYKSSMASVIHFDIRKKLGIPGAGKVDADLSDSERETIETLEHKRWNAYMRSEGFIYSGSKDKKSRNDLGKMHHNLVVFDELSDEDKRKDSRVGTK